MSYRIEKGEGLAPALDRIAAEEMHAALSKLRRRDKGEAVHSARKAIKRLRALLRSLRVVFPEKMFHTENQRLARAGRKISPVRDLHVQLCTLGKLSNPKSRAGLKMRRDLLRRQENLNRKIPALRSAVRRLLGDSRGAIQSWPLNKITPVALAAGLKRIYKQGKAAFQCACRDPRPEHLHEWRKKSKRLEYGFELIEHLVPKKIAKPMRACHELGDVLGDDHDLFMVSQILARENQSKPAPDFAALSRRIASERGRLRKRAFKLGKKIYAEKPRDFARRLDRRLRHKIDRSD